MRGLEEIIASNENPSAYYASREPQHGHVENSDANRSFESNLADKRRRDQAFHGERVEARQAERAEVLTGNKAVFVLLNEVLAGEKLSQSEIDEMAAVADTLDAAGVEHPIFYSKAKELARTLADRSRLNDKGDRADRARHVGQEGILSAIDGQPPFLKFWAKLNAQREHDGLGEALYGEAKEAFQGGPTPEGALTFVGKQWDGLRAVPARAFEGHKTYHGEFRQTTEDGTIWRTVHNGHGPIDYASPEAALNGARHAKAHSEAHKS